jgi:hypothetical protein
VTPSGGDRSGAGISLLVGPASLGGEDPIGERHERGYTASMNTLLLIIVLLLLFGGGGFYIGGPAYGGGGLGLILLICIIVYLFGGFRTKN